MNTISYILRLILVYAILCLTLLQLYAQVPATLSSIVETSRSHSIGCGISYIHADVTEERIGIAGSFLYRQAFGQTWSAEGNLQFTGHSRRFEDRLYPNNLLQHSIAGALMAWYHGLFIPELNAGAGIMGRIHNRMMTGYVSNNTNLDVEFSVLHSSRWAIGGLAALEYMFVRSDRLTWSVRAQAALMSTPIIGTLEDQFLRQVRHRAFYGYGGFISLGVFLHIDWQNTQ